MKLVPRVVVAVSLYLGVLGVGCRGGGGEEEPEPDGPVTPQENKIQDVHNATMAEGAKVKLDGVVVTAIDAYGGRLGNFWVQEPEGGPFSGVLVFGAKTADVGKLSVGDIVNLDGLEKDEFLPQDDATNRTITELRAVRGGVISITPVGKGAAPTPQVVDLAAIAAMPPAQAEAEMEKWEGVFITVKNVAQLNDKRPASSTDLTFFDFTLPGGLVVDTTLMAFPDTSVADACYDSITGVGDYFYNYKILPRNPGDLVLGTGCATPTPTTISTVQAGTYPKTGLQPNLVLVRDAIITAITVSADTGRANFKSLWVSTNHAAAANEAVQIFMGSTPIPAAAAIGAKIDVLGTAIEFDNSGSSGDKLTEINRPAVKVKNAPDGTPVTALDAIPLTTVSSITDGEPYEGVLLHFTNLKVTALGAAGDTVTVTDQSGATITVDDDIFDYAATDLPVDACYSSFDAIASLNTLDNKRILLPRVATDLTLDASGTACTPVVR
jgi:predicted extracellular nuclease